VAVALGATIDVSINGTSKLVLAPSGATTGDSSKRFSTFIALPSFGSFYISVEDKTDLEKVGTGGSFTGSFSASGIIGGSSFFCLGLLGCSTPYTYSAIFSAEGSATSSGGATTGQFSESESGSYTFYYSVEEHDPSGTVVATTDFSSLTWSSGLLQQASVTAGDNALQWQVNTGTGTDNFVVNITMITSQQSGTLNLQNSFINPKQIETVIDITGYTYASPVNNLVLVLYSSIINANVSGTISSTTGAVSAGTGSNAVYVAFSGSAVVDGKYKSLGTDAVTTTEVSSGEFAGGSDSVGTVTGSFSDSVKIVYAKHTISFPAGAEAISYDPKSGYGTQPNYSGAESRAAGFLGALLMTLVMLLAF